MAPDTRRTIPPVHLFVSDPAIAAYEALVGKSELKRCVSAVLAPLRAAPATEAIPPFDALRSQILKRLAAAEASGLVSVLNGTGVLLHTNFGRAPLAGPALEAVVSLGAGYTNLEFDLETGERGSRYERVSAQLCELAGAEAALVVNNCAAAVLLVLDTFARGRDVVVSRGQLIEIGGSFRLPDVVRKSGANLVEVGTTNKTYGADYREAWSDRTAVLMRTHPSNYRVEGFVAEVGAAALAAIAKELNVISFEDLGSGAFIDLRPFGLPHEPTVAEEIAAGIDLVAVSGDKLLGGPQCGIIAGRRHLVERIKANPLLRALRVGKLTVAALSGTLALYLEPGRLNEIPFYAMLSADADELFARASALARTIRRDASAAIDVSAVKTVAAAGGGTLPVTEIPSAGLAIVVPSLSAQGYAKRLRGGRPPVVGLINERGFVIDLRTIDPAQDAALCGALVRAARGS